MASATVSLIVNANMFDTIRLTGTHNGNTADPWSKENILDLSASKYYEDTGNALDLSFNLRSANDIGSRYNAYSVRATYTWSFGDEDISDWRDRRDYRDRDRYRNDPPSPHGSDTGNTNDKFSGFPG